MSRVRKDDCSTLYVIKQDMRLQRATGIAFNPYSLPYVLKMPVCPGCSRRCKSESGLLSHLAQSVNPACSHIYQNLFHPAHGGLADGRSDEDEDVESTTDDESALHDEDEDTPVLQDLFSPDYGDEELPGLSAQSSQNDLMAPEFSIDFYGDDQDVDIPDADNDLSLDNEDIGEPDLDEYDDEEEEACGSYYAFVYMLGVLISLMS